jgi:hypothetical protein
MVYLKDKTLSKQHSVLTKQSVQDWVKQLPANLEIGVNYVLSNLRKNPTGYRLYIDNQNKSYFVIEYNSLYFYWEGTPYPYVYENFR